MIQITPQMRVLVAIEPTDFRRGIDGLARLCKQTLQQDPFCGWMFVFPNRKATAVKILVYDGQGFWLFQKRLSSGRFRWWPKDAVQPAQTLAAHQLQVLTLFLRVPGAPLDNNVCERALKMAIRHRKNSLFYKTQRGADVGDLYMSLIRTCYSSGASPVDYLTELQRNHERVRAAPGDWMPWNYREQLVAAESEPGRRRGLPGDVALSDARSP